MEIEEEGSLLNLFQTLTYLNTKTKMDREQAKHCVGPGWSGLVDELYDKKGDTEITYLKEKYGTFRIEANNCTDSFFDLECELSEKSSHICESCGEPGELQTDIPWYKTMCDGCKKEDRLKRVIHR
jgi:hypothetical protein